MLLPKFRNSLTYFLSSRRWSNSGRKTGYFLRVFLYMDSLDFFFYWFVKTFQWFLHLKEEELLHRGIELVCS